MSKPPKHVPLPTREQLLEFIRESPGRVGKREIARAFHLTAENRNILRQMIKDLEKSGEIERGRGRRFAGPGALPETMVVEISAIDDDGELLAKPLTWTEDGRPPKIYMAPGRRGEAPLGMGDRVLARLRRMREGIYEARAVRRITAGPAKVLGVYEHTADGAGRLRPTDRRQKADYSVLHADSHAAQPGELVLAEILPGGRPYGLRPARVVERLGSMDNPRTVSLVAIQTHDIPNEFTEEVIAQADAALAAPLENRTDLRMIPLVTIDGEDARDFDDAVWAEALEDGGWHILVAIADVAWYVRPGDALDHEAFKRGNSVYFPDRVVPMLPEALSNGWCSLKPDEDRPCMAVHIWLDADGHKRRHEFVRGLMRSKARLTYERVQRALDGAPDEGTAPLLEPVLKPLYGAWRALFAARERRGVLDLDLPERKVVIGADGRIEKVIPRERYDSHRLIEDYMIAANVAAAEQIEATHRPCMYRVHDVPSREKLEGLRDFLSTVGLSLPKGQVMRASAFNQILAAARETPEAHLINEVVLRSQAQAVYSPENIGHFGLGLARYAHFTSPIRRYSDLLVHRALIDGLNLGAGALPADSIERFAEIGEHISLTERRAAAAERDALNRFTTLFLADRVGARFAGRINGVTRFGLFVTLDETGADGLIPVSSLPEDYYIHDETRHCLVGKRFGLTFSLGDIVEVELAEANALTGSLLFQLLNGKEAPRSKVPPRGADPRDRARPRGKRPPPRRKH
ncbi:ribonuclease R [Telmatospirillum siberiense]|uniref:Ribonuclease R n=1 Tax=Telmatospirillum siberiense TaxID=382514 RepID=A0A2N3PM48_9PROT|nr:ribonuclease R [Telmatospirillum siberiense]PKU21474.1 ribonuclease R [Telmatospirillum siberiense]